MILIASDDNDNTKLSSLAQVKAMDAFYTWKQLNHTDTQRAT